MRLKPAAQMADAESLYQKKAQPIADAMSAMRIFRKDNGAIDSVWVDVDQASGRERGAPAAPELMKVPGREI
jgi:hypothetical protein